MLPRQRGEEDGVLAALHPRPGRRRAAQRGHQEPHRQHREPLRRRRACGRAPAAAGAPAWPGVVPARVVQERDHPDDVGPTASEGAAVQVPHAPGSRERGRLAHRRGAPEGRQARGGAPGRVPRRGDLRLAGPVPGQEQRLHGAQRQGRDRVGQEERPRAPGGEQVVQQRQAGAELRPPADGRPQRPEGDLCARAGPRQELRGDGGEGQPPGRGPEDRPRRIPGLQEGRPGCRRGASRGVQAGYPEGYAGGEDSNREEKSASQEGGGGEEEGRGGAEKEGRRGQEEEARGR
mmetsp:Transcript_4808/g.12677  ORF Transcript_4808/g.12677 Transcript_4808/m.12677 type:complete len:291 (-) Transcript_4808:1112-1984(-)